MLHLINDERANKVSFAQLTDVLKHDADTAARGASAGVFFNT